MCVQTKDPNVDLQKESAKGKKRGGGPWKERGEIGVWKPRRYKTTCERGFQGDLGGTGTATKKKEKRVPRGTRSKKREPTVNGVQMRRKKDITTIIKKKYCVSRKGEREAFE